MAQKNQDIDRLDKEDFLKALGQQIKKIREEKGLSAAEFGRRAFIERSHIARLETGGTNPTATTLINICRALDIQLEDLFKDFRY